MKKLQIILLAGAAAMLAFSSCEQNVMEVYDKNPCLYFPSGQANSDVTYSFYLKGTRTRDTVWVQVNLVGNPLKEPRRLPLRIVDAGENNAVPGVHYVGIDDPGIAHWYVMPANSISNRIPVILLRDPSLRQTQYTVKLELYQTGEFGRSIDDSNHYTIKLSDMGEKPTLWYWWEFYFGKWGQVKMKFIIDYTGYSDFENRVPSEMAKYLKMKAKEKLAEYEKEHGYLKEDDEVTIVEFPD